MADGARKSAVLHFNAKGQMAQSSQRRSGATPFLLSLCDLSELCVNRRDGSLAKEGCVLSTKTPPISAPTKMTLEK